MSVHETVPQLRDLHMGESFLQVPILSQPVFVAFFHMVRTAPDRLQKLHLAGAIGFRQAPIDFSRVEPGIHVHAMIEKALHAGDRRYVLRGHLMLALRKPSAGKSEAVTMNLLSGPRSGNSLLKDFARRHLFDVLSTMRLGHAVFILPGHSQRHIWVQRAQRSAAAALLCRPLEVAGRFRGPLAANMRGIRLSHCAARSFREINSLSLLCVPGVVGC